MTISNANNIVERVNDYALQKGITQQEAARKLISIGLMVENDGIYISELSRALTRVLTEEVMSIKSVIRSELQGVSDTIDERLISAESASYASLFATLKGNMNEAAPVAADIYTIAGNRYAAGESMDNALKRAKELRESGERC